ncbi:hypothetical protein DL98DRAFT_594028 [Cadophora sp. DSE1049]|nr:hypothetical protein DL98DRAFT_594028 [Cadophora sp. DSE1049]
MSLAEIILYLLITLTFLFAAMHWELMGEISISVFRSVYTYLHSLGQSINAYLDYLDRSMDDHLDSLDACFSDEAPVVYYDTAHNCITETVDRTEFENENETGNANIDITDDEVAQMEEARRAGRMWIGPDGTFYLKNKGKVDLLEFSGSDEDDSEQGDKMKGAGLRDERVVI